MEIINFLIKPRTQRNSLRAYVGLVNATGSDNAGLNSPSAKEGLKRKLIISIFPGRFELK